MCGIFGTVSLDGAPLRFPQLLAPMAESLQHRGPDSRKIHSEESFAVGSQRLRIIDLRARADQPFSDSDERCWMVCNGEIYNYPELRRRYADYPYRSNCDIEVILPLYLDRGPAGLADLDGMFGLAIWDKRSSTLVVARDRAGEKPLFYCRIGSELWFASELQTLLLHPEMTRELDEEAARQFLALGYIVEPATAYRGLRKVGAGTIHCFSAAGDEVEPYWRPGEIVAAAVQDPPSVTKLQELLVTAVHKQMASDVPVGVFVSGGLDSALLARLVNDESDGSGVHTFVARFAESSYDESEWAAACGRRLGARHHEVLVDERSLQEALTGIVDAVAEPLADPAVLPTWLLARDARRHVGVVLSGEGADELFGGYPTYLGHRLASKSRFVPASLLRGLRSLVQHVPASRRKVTFDFLLRRFLADFDRPWLERHLGWFAIGAQRCLLDDGTALSALPDTIASQLPDGSGGALLLDYCTYLREGLLVKMDRSTMLHSLEARVPYLDVDLTSFAMGVSERYQIKGLTTKWLLKRAAEKWLPRKVIYRRKRGLSVPIADWIDNGLRSEVDRLLAPDRLARQELFDPASVELLLGEHRARKANHARSLWAIIMFQYWLERWIPGRA